jgi:hypothetical protein
VYGLLTFIKQLELFISTYISDTWMIILWDRLIGNDNENITNTVAPRKVAFESIRSSSQRRLLSGTSKSMRISQTKSAKVAPTAIVDFTNDNIDIVITDDNCGDNIIIPSSIIDERHHQENQELLSLPLQQEQLVIKQSDAEGEALQLTKSFNQILDASQILNEDQLHFYKSKLIFERNRYFFWITVIFITYSVVRGISEEKL